MVGWENNIEPSKIHCRVKVLKNSSYLCLVVFLIKAFIWETNGGYVGGLETEGPKEIPRAGHVYSIVMILRFWLGAGFSQRDLPLSSKERRALSVWESLWKKQRQSPVFLCFLGKKRGTGSVYFCTVIFTDGLIIYRGLRKVFVAKEGGTQRRKLIWVCLSHLSEWGCPPRRLCCLAWAFQLARSSFWRQITGRLWLGEANAEWSGSVGLITEQSRHLENVCESY